MHAIETKSCVSLQMKSILSKGIFWVVFSNHFRMTAFSYTVFLGIADNSQAFSELHQIIVRLEASRIGDTGYYRDFKHI